MKLGEVVCFKRSEGRVYTDIGVKVLPREMLKQFLLTFSFFLTLHAAYNWNKYLLIPKFILLSYACVSLNILVLLPGASLDLSVHGATS